MLDNNNLINLKAKLGVSPSGKNTTAMYLKSRSLEKELQERLRDKFTYPIELNIFIDKILEKVNSIELCEMIRVYFERSDDDVFIKEASKIKSFMIKMKKMVGDMEKTCDDDDEAYYRCEEDTDVDLEDIL